MCECLCIPFHVYLCIPGYGLWCYRCVGSHPGCGLYDFDWRYYWSHYCPDPNDKCVKVIEQKGSEFLLLFSLISVVYASTHSSSSSFPSFPSVSFMSICCPNSVSIFPYHTYPHSLLPPGDVMVTRDCLSFLEGHRRDIPADRYEGCRPSATDHLLGQFIFPSIPEIDHRRWDKHKEILW